MAVEHTGEDLLCRFDGFDRLLAELDKVHRHNTDVTKFEAFGTAVLMGTKRKDGSFGHATSRKVAELDELRQHGFAVDDTWRGFLLWADAGLSIHSQEAVLSLCVWWGI